MYINDDVYHREEGDQKGAIARFVSLTGRVFLVSPDSSWVILSSDMKETACGDIQGHTDDKECTLEAGSPSTSTSRCGRDILGSNPSTCNTYTSEPVPASSKTQHTCNSFFALFLADFFSADFFFWFRLARM